MFLRILKKDIKRKKTMNLIILLFVILSTMFFASSVNNIVSVMGGLDRYFEMAGMKDEGAVVSEPGSGEPFGDHLDDNPDVKSYTRETVLRSESVKITFKGNEIKDLEQVFFSAPDEMCLKCFDENNQPITSVEDGKVMITGLMQKKTGAEKGDIITFDFEGRTLSLECAGICKDAVFGPDMVNYPRLLISRGDFDRLMADEELRNICRTGNYIIEIDGGKAADMYAEASDCRIIFHGSKETLKTAYIIDIAVAAIVLAVSLFLIVISLVVLRFTIGFTITEEFREIGVMKAMGLKNSSIRILYLVKYLCIAVTGAVTGFFAAIPFGNMLLGAASKSIVLGNDHPILSGIVCSAIICAVILLFCHKCTAKIKKLSPIDAVRNGQTGERFSRRSLMSLGKSRLGTSGFLSLNDVISSPRQSAVLALVFTLCAALVMVIANLGASFKSEKMMPVIGIKKSDLYISDTSRYADIKSGKKTLEETNRELEKLLSDNGMQADVYAELVYDATIRHGDGTYSTRMLHCKDTSAADYPYTEGTAPRYSDEIALTNIIAQKAGVKIGDRLTLILNGEEKEYLLTALFDCCNNLGMVGRLSESCEMPESQMLWANAFQVNFTDSPDAQTIEERKNKITELINDDDVEIYNTSGYVSNALGAADAIDGAKILTLAVSLVIIALMSVLIERSFISKEKAEIALMKAIGFKSRSVIGVHVLRFIIVGAVSSAIAAALSTPATKLIIEPLFGMLGALKGTGYEVNKLETFVIIPAAVTATIVISAGITALFTGSVKASDTSDIE